MYTLMARPKDLALGFPAGPGERIELSVRPAPVSIVLRAKWPLCICLLTAVAGVVVVVMDIAPRHGLAAVELSVLLALAILIVEAIQRLATRYTLTDRRMVAEWGVFTRHASELGLSSIRHLAERRSLLERAFGLGTLAAATAGAEGYEVVWRSVSEPESLARAVRARLLAWNSGVGDGSGRLPGHTRSAMMAMMGLTPPAPSIPEAARAIPIIGLAGGIGAGKSTVAAAFERQGCYIVDSDARAKAALDRPEVRDELVRWWGPGILGDAGRVDRSRIAEIVFGSPAERARLEGLVHPIVRQDRAELIAEASKFWPKAVVVDAPLLFEAGVDKECDAVVFVDATREERLRRVREARGWDEAELARREASQWPLERKRLASGFVVQNAGPDADVEGQVGRVLLAVHASEAERQGPARHENP